MPWHPWIDYSSPLGPVSSSVKRVTGELFPEAREPRSLSMVPGEPILLPGPGQSTLLVVLVLLIFPVTPEAAPAC